LGRFHGETGVSGVLLSIQAVELREGGREGGNGEFEVKKQREAGREGGREGGHT